MADPLIAVTGATGYVGGRVASLLAARGARQRLVVRDSARAPRLDGAEVREASGYGAAGEMRAALEGAHTLFLVPGEEAPDRVAQHETAIDAAVAAGVERIVYLSFLGASPDSTFLLVRDHWATEEHVKATGLRWSFVRMSLYLDFIPSMIGADGVVAGPADDGRFAPVARADVAEVVAAVLLAEGHDGAVHDATGGRLLTFARIADELARLSGRPVTFHDETLEEARASRSQYGAPDWQVHAWISTYTAIAAGELDRVTDTVERLTGHAPTTLADFVREHPESLAHVRG